MPEAGPRIFSDTLRTLIAFGFIEATNFQPHHLIRIWKLPTVPCEPYAILIANLSTGLLAGPFHSICDWELTWRHHVEFHNFTF
eukprot:2278366-Rhodomonas_salina.1